MASQQDLDKAYMDIAVIMSKLSTAVRRKVGAVLVKNEHIIAEGYNGTPKGFSNVCEYETYAGTLTTKEQVLHAEENVICKVARSTSSSSGSTLYVTSNPCLGCAKLLIQAGIVRVVYKDLYTTDSGFGISLLAEAGIPIEQL